MKKNLRHIIQSLIGVGIFCFCIVSINAETKDKSTFMQIGGNEKNTDDTDLTRKAILMGTTGQYDRALKQFLQIVNIQRDRLAKTYNNIGYVYELKGEPDKAIQFYHKALSYNENLIEPNSKLGHIYFTQEKWEEAVRLGENTLKLDPTNTEVKKWLPIAYDKLLEQRKAKILGQKTVESKKKNLLKAKVLLNVESKGLTRVDHKEKSVQVRHYAGLKYPYKSPTKIDLWFFPLDRWAMQLMHESPDLGLLNPDLIYSRQNLSFFYRLGNIHLGMGFLTSQLNTRQVWHDGKDLILQNTDAEISDIRTDMKLGVTFAHQIRGTHYFFQYFPRGYPRVTNDTGGLAYDFTEFSFQLHKNMPTYKIFLNILMRDVYVYQFNVALDTDKNIVAGTKSLSHYYAHNDLSMGVEFNVLRKGKDFPFDWLVRLEWGGRVYFRDVKNEEPFKIFNGQGFFGFTPTDFLEGGLFKGFYKSAFLLRLGMIQRVHYMFHLKENVEFEIIQASYQHGLNVMLGSEITFY